MPDGIYGAESFLDNDRSGDEPLPIRVKVTVHGDEMTVDYSEMAEQVKGPINSGYFGGGQTTARVAFKYLLGASRDGQRRHVPAAAGWCCRRARFSAPRRPPPWATTRPRSRP